MGLGAGWGDFFGGAAEAAGNLINYSITSKLQAQADEAKAKKLFELKKKEIEYEQGFLKEREAAGYTARQKEAEVEYSQGLIEATLSSNAAMAKWEAEEAGRNARNAATNEARDRATQERGRSSGRRPTKEQAKTLTEAVPGIIRRTIGLEPPPKESPWSNAWQSRD